ncbi:MAG: hypothetical protein LUQ65_14055 [Candidatus Helarchaeota archaeon]|nr:hypothetical protein [Candidatus Helarchaeota archaeon]
MEKDIVKEVVLNLTTLEIFFIITTILSLFLNLYQLMTARKEKAALRAPLSNSLIALFNDVKSKTTSLFETQQFLFSKQNPHKEIDTLRWDYFQFTKNVINFLSGFQESLVGTLVTLNPEDKEGEKAFKAANYGLTEQEKELRRGYMERFKDQQMKQLKEGQP